MQQYQLTFIDLALSRDALRFGHFALKSGRQSPYFFNAGLFSDGEALATLGKCYAAAIVYSGIRFDMVFGPAYKGIALAVATAVALSAEHGRSVPCAFNRKEAKDHGEGGRIVGAPLQGRVLIVDDVITAGAQPAGVVLALDRQERGQGAASAVQELEQQQGLQCVSIVTLSDLIEALSGPPAGRARISAEQLTALRAYQQRYGAA